MKDSVLFYENWENKKKLRREKNSQNSGCTISTQFFRQNLEKQGSLRCQTQIEQKLKEERTREAGDTVSSQTELQWALIKFLST